MFRIMLDKQPICSTDQCNKKINPICHLYKIAIQLLTFIHKDHSLRNINSILKIHLEHMALGLESNGSLNYLLFATINLA